MKKDIVIKATYRTDSIYSEGYFCVNGVSIKGIFGLDFLEITYDSKFFHLFIFEREHPSYPFYEDFHSEYFCLHYGYTTINYPGEYQFINNNRSLLTLKFESVVSSIEKQKSIISELSKIAL